MTTDNEPIEEDYYLRYPPMKGPDEFVKGEPNLTEQQRIEKEAKQWLRSMEWMEAWKFPQAKEGYIAGANATRLRYIEALKELIEISDEYVTLENVKEMNAYPYYQKEYEKIKSAIEKSKSLIQ